MQWSEKADGDTFQLDKGVSTEKEEINERIRKSPQQYDLMEALNVVGQFYSSSDAPVPKFTAFYKLQDYVTQPAIMQAQTVFFGYILIKKNQF
ncbi:hypothetical protein AVEN_194939-1 [Araneus ventricosus]|uniref:Uncharacterized protein n=1 Tax=Araneus ventricosus TaxID=182803 RepID=A0A4Y2EWT5_ARAVE|nr:hypothetical protein AVEN_194939-1 [Araneus ventricosus]